MESYLCMKRVVNATKRWKTRYEDSQLKIAEAGKLIQNVNQSDEENTGKVAELNAKEAEAEKTVVEAEEARVGPEAVRAEAEKAIVEYRESDDFIALVDKEVMAQCDDFMYRVKQYNANKKFKSTSS